MRRIRPTGRAPRVRLKVGEEMGLGQVGPRRQSACVQFQSRESQKWAARVGKNKWAARREIGPCTILIFFPFSIPNFISFSLLSQFKLQFEFKFELCGKFVSKLNVHLNMVWDEFIYF
jgi:hypothetical protein